MLSAGIRTLFNKIPKNSFLSRNFSSLKMPKAFVRCVDNESTLSLTFVYSNGIKERQFNFNRVQTETIGASLHRISENVKRKVKQKKSKKVKKVEAGLPETNQQEVQIAAQVLIGEVPCNEESLCKDSLVNGARLKIGDTLYDIVVNAPTVSSLTLPTNIMAGFPVHPKIDTEFAEKGKCEFRWYRSANEVMPVEEQVGNSKSKSGKPVLQKVKDWQEVGTEFCYRAKTEDVGRVLRVTCTPISSDGFAGPLAEAISTVAVSAGPGRCPFDSRHELTKSVSEPGSFRFVSYNILADQYADSDFSRENLFPYCPPYALSIDYRKQLFLKEIIGYNADIVCLQEVDKKVFENDLLPALEALGFTGLFSIKGGQVTEGLACFFRNTKFKLVDHHSIILADAIQSSPILTDILETVNRNENLKERLLRRTTALQVVLLESEELPEQFLCIGNNHLYFHPDADHIRLLQAGTALLQLEQVAALAKSKNPSSDVAVAVCGDFNSTPPFGVFQLMTTQFIPEDHADWSSNESQAVKNLSLTHPFQMESACGTPPYTNFTVGFADCLDYIFVDSSQIAVEKVVPLPSEEEMREHTALPSVTLPSDHVALVCDLTWKKAKN